MGLLLPLFVFACGAPGPNETNGDGGGNTGEAACTLTISGAVTASTGCTVAATADAQGVHFGVRSSDNTFAFVSDRAGTSLDTGTFALSATTKTIATVNKGTAVWSEMYGDSQKPNQGDATYTLTSTGQSYTGSNGTGWLGEHGTLTATLQPADQFATGTVNVSVTF